MKTTIVILLGVLLTGCLNTTPTTYNIIKDSELIISREMKDETNNLDYHIFNLTMDRIGDVKWKGEFVDIYGDLYVVSSEIDNGLVRCRWVKSEHILDTVKLSNNRMYINGKLQ